MGFVPSSRYFDRICSQVCYIHKSKVYNLDFPMLRGKWKGEKEESVSDFIFLGSKITADCDCSYEIERSLLFGRKVKTNLDSMLKRKDITFLTKVHIVKTMVFPVVMHGCESQTREG